MGKREIEEPKNMFDMYGIEDQDETEFKTLEECKKFCDDKKYPYTMIVGFYKYKEHLTGGVPWDGEICYDDVYYYSDFCVK